MVSRASDTSTLQPTVAESIATFRRARLGRAALSFDARLGAVSALSEAIMARDPAIVHLPPAGLAFAAGFLQARHLEHLISRELPHPDALSRFVCVGERKALRVLPRGLVCHWIAGNVPLLGLFSWALSAVVGNLNVLRPSSRGGDVLTPVLRFLATVSDEGRELAADTLIVSFPRDDIESNRAMSAAADVRLAWGGLDAVEAVLSLPGRWDCDTVVLGPRMSVAVIDPTLATGRVLSRLASDIAYFEQQSCSSPQWVFVKGRRGDPVFDSTVDALANQLADQTRHLGRQALDEGETYRVQLDRARVLLEGGLLHRDRETAWTVAVLDVPDPRVACTNRFVQVVPFAAVSEVCRWIPNNVQTATMLLEPSDAEVFSELAARCGVCRFPRPGEANHFETPWDGIPLVSRLTRCVVRTEAAP